MRVVMPCHGLGLATALILRNFVPRTGQGRGRPWGGMAPYRERSKGGAGLWVSRILGPLRLGYVAS
jgi:hypothetical protein